MRNTKLLKSFFCLLYNVPLTVQTADEARCILFPKATTPNALPPTSDALRFHIQRCHFQSMVWLQASQAEMVLPPPGSLGWKVVDEKLIPQLTSLEPIPRSCLEIITCQCTKGCGTLRCKCRKAKLYCTGAYRCYSQGSPCINDQ